MISLYPLLIRETVGAGYLENLRADHVSKQPEIFGDCACRLQFLAVSLLDMVVDFADVGSLPIRVYLAIEGQRAFRLHLIGI